MEINKKSWLMDLIWLTLGIALLFMFMLGARALSVPDEARYTEIPREMLGFHDFITPHLDGVKYFEKPPLLYWIQAGVMHFFGVNEFFLRLPTAIFALLGCVATYVAGRLSFNRMAGILGAGVLATSPLYFAMAHSITLDMTLTLWITLGLFSFLIAVELPPASKARRYVAWLMFVFAAFAVLTKGLVGIILPGAVIFSWLLIFNRWKVLFSLPLVSGLIIFFAIALPWHILVQMKNPEFFHFYFIDQQFTRYLTKAAGRYKPFWWFAPILLGGLFPWVVFLFQACKDSLKTSWANRGEKQKEIFLLLWAAEIFLFFSLSDSKLIPYILPVLPPLALLIGKYLAEIATPESVVIPAHAGIHVNDRKMDSRVRGNDGMLGNDGYAFGFLIGLSFLLAAACLSAPLWHHNFLPAAVGYLRLMALPLFLMGIGLGWIKNFKIKLLWIFAMQVCLLWSFVAAVPSFDLRPIKPLALQLKALAKPQDVIASYGLYYQDLPVYTQRVVLIVDWKNELTFGYQHQASAKEFLIDAGKFWQLWHGSARVFAVMDHDDYVRSQASEKLYVLGQHDDDLLVSNQP